MPDYPCHTCGLRDVVLRWVEGSYYCSQCYQDAVNQSLERERLEWAFRSKACVKAEVRAALAERALQACKQYGHGYRFSTVADVERAGETMLTTAEQIAAELAALEAQHG